VVAKVSLHFLDAKISSYGNRGRGCFIKNYFGNCSLWPKSSGITVNGHTKLTQVINEKRLDIRL
jgi:hypothetical protein